MKTKTSGEWGFTLLEIMIVTALIGCLSAIAIPFYARARTTSQQNACINNLRQIDGAKQQWALDTKQAGTATPGYTDISVYLKSAVVCPAAGTATNFSDSYEINNVATPPQCKIPGTAHVMPAETTS